MSNRDFLVLCLTFLVIMNTLTLMVTSARVRGLQALHKEAVIENRFLSRKIGELHDESDIRFSKMECQVDLAVTGFRMGHNNAYRMMSAGMFKNCKGVYNYEPTYRVRAETMRW